jgi:LuxR family maltose regulon positive regulatory protein
MPQLVLIKVLMSQGTKDSQQQATDLLNQLNDFFESIHNRIFRIHVLALQALHYDTLGERPVALEKLAKALDLAEPGGFIRLFMDLGPQMADLLKQLIKQNVAVGYISRILAVLKEDAHKAGLDASDPNGPSSHNRFSSSSSNSAFPLGLHPGGKAEQLMKTI